MSNSQNPQFKLTYLNGSKMGQGFGLVGDEISIGRSDENNVVLDDLKASRKHVQIVNRDGNYWVVNLKSENEIQVNGLVTSEKQLVPGDILLIGETTLEFNAINALVVANPPPQPVNVELGNDLPPVPKKTKPPSRSSRSSSPSLLDFDMESAAPLAIGAIIVVALLLYFASGSSSSSEPDSGQAIQASRTNDDLQTEIIKSGKANPQYIQSQDLYMQGFRDYRESNFARAITAFTTSLAYNPNNVLAKSYLARSQLKLKETAALALTTGEKNFTLGRYMQARSDYNRVVVLVNDPRNESYLLARKRLEAIELIIRTTR